jgi:hypothetical protein
MAYCRGKNWRGIPVEKLKNGYIQAGFARVSPYRKPASYYLSRFIGHDIERTDWDLRVGEEKIRTANGPVVGHSVIATSAQLPKELFRQTLGKRKKR